MTIAEDEKKIDDFVEEHQEYEDDVELADAKYVEEHIEFIVPQSDDPNTPAWTVRSVLLGVIFATLLAFGNTVLSFRSNPFLLPSSLVAILSFPMGVFMAQILPEGFLNPGPFSIKEHILIYIMASSGGVPYGIDNVVTQMHPDLMGNTSITFMHAFGFILVTQFLGYSWSGLTRRFLVKPTAMWWPGNLPTIAMFSSFHKVDSAEEGTKYTWSRTTVFWVAFLVMFLYEWIPEFAAPVLQAVSITCLFAGKGSGASGVLSNYNAVAGSALNGVGFLGLSFDWNFIGSIYFAMPFWANCMNMFGNVVFLWVVTPLCYTTDVFGLNKVLGNGANPTVNSAGLFVGAANGTKPQGAQVSPSFFYNVSDNYNINLTAYNDVAPIHLTSMFMLSYASSFLTVTAAAVHVALWYGKDIYRQTMNAFRQMRDEVDALDKHVKMMEAYPEVPDWFYMIFLAVTTVGAILVSVLTPFNMPWWGIFFNLFMVTLFVVPYGAVTAITGIGLYLNVVSEFIIGLMIPGQTVAVMAFKSWGTNNLLQALNLSGDLKIGQYMHIPPYAMVASQFLGTFVNVVVSTAAVWYMTFSSGGLLNIKSVDWNMYNYRVFYSAGGIWGAIGPQRFFGIGSIYAPTLWCFLIGALCPVFPWLGNKFLVKSKYWHYINFPVFFQFVGPTSYQVLIVPAFLACCFSQLWMFNRNREFYQKYLFVMGAGFDTAGGVVSLIVSFLSVAGISNTQWTTVNPNTNNVPLDYYCYPGASHLDYDCNYYLSQGSNMTAENVFCPAPTTSAKL